MSTADDVRQMRSEGKTYKEIGDLLGFSRQRAYQLMASPETAKKEKRPKLGPRTMPPGTERLHYQVKQQDCTRCKGAGSFKFNKLPRTSCRHHDVEGKESAQASEVTKVLNLYPNKIHITNFWTNENHDIYFRFSDRRIFFVGHFKIHPQEADRPPQSTWGIPFNEVYLHKDIWAEITKEIEKSKMPDTPEPQTNPFY